MTRRDIPGRLTICCAIACLTAAGEQIADACSCIMPPPPREALRESDAVFSGRVIAVEDHDGEYLVQLRVADVWKGVDREVVWMRTGPGNCAIWFVLNSDYLIYAYRDGDDLATNMCTRTAGLEDADADVTALGPPLDIELKPAVSTSEYVLGGALLAGLLIVILGVWRVGWRQ